MAHVGPPGASGNVLVSDGTKWGSGIIPTTGSGTGPQALGVPKGRYISWLNVFSNAQGAAGVTSFTLSNLAGASAVPSFNRTDSFLGLPWTGFGTSVSTAGSNACQRNSATGTSLFFVGNTTGVGGFYFQGRLGLQVGWVNTNATFLGFRADQTAPAGGALPGNFVNACGFGHDSGDTTLQFFTNDGSGTCTKFNTGLTLSAKSGWDCEMWCPSGTSNTIYFSATTVVGSSGVGTTYSNSVNTNVPAANTVMGWMIYCTNGATAVTAQVAIGEQYMEGY